MRFRSKFLCNLLQSCKSNKKERYTQVKIRKLIKIMGPFLI